MRCITVDGNTKCGPHNGTDISVPTSTAVVAPASLDGGQVVRSGWEDPQNHKKGLGRRVTVDVVIPQNK